MSGPVSGPELRLVDAAEIRARLEQRSTARPAAPSNRTAAVEPERRRLREAVVLQDYFAAADLPGPAEAIHWFITQDCVRVGTADGGGWRLSASVRADTLRALRTPERVLAAVRSLPAPDGDVSRRMAEQYLAGTAPAADRQTPAQLAASLRVSDWLSVLPVSLPDVADLQAHLELANILQPMRTVAGSDFVGREVELAELAAFVDQPSTVRAPIPMVVHGPGGIGKSTLIARFVLDRLESGTPFAYLTFDRYDLLPQRPMSILAEVARQLRSQAPDQRAELDDLILVLRENETFDLARQNEPQGSIRGSVDVIERAARNESMLVRRFARCFRAAARPDRPYIWVLDTFEQAQRYGELALQRLWKLLAEVRSALPEVRLLIAGRSAVTDTDVVARRLGGLTPEAGLSYLRGRLPGVEVPDRFLRRVVERVRNNPLSLRLVADLMVGESGRLARSAGRRRLLFQLDDAQVQGVLYRRVLGRIADPDVRALANPGLVLRQVTADLIREVLARPCGLGEVDADRAEQLFQALRSEVSLVESSDADVLIHRADVREMVLPLLVAANPDAVKGIHRRAVQYYAHRAGLRAKVEELYHRLMLGQSARTMTEHWNGPAGELLAPALDELPASSRVLLAEHLGFVVESADLAQADNETWARQAVRQARELLESGRPTAALTLLAERPDWFDHAVTALRVEALATLGRTKEALHQVVTGLAAATDGIRLESYLELALLGARVAEEAGQYEQALGWLSDARRSAELLDDRVKMLTADVNRLRVHRRSGRDDPALRRRVLTGADLLTSRERNQNPSLIRDLAAEIGDQRPEFLIEAAQLVGLDVLNDPAKLATGLTQDELSELVGHVRPVADPGTSAPVTIAIPGESAAPGTTAAQEPAAEPVEYEEYLTSAEQGRRVADYLAETLPADPVWGSLGNLYKLESDAASFDYRDE